MKKVAVISMGQAPEDLSGHDLYQSLSEQFDTTLTGLLDGKSAEEIAALAPEDGENFIVSTVRGGAEVRIAERHAMALVNEKLLYVQEAGFSAALIMCTGHFEIPDIRIPVFVPEKILFTMFRILGVRKLGAIVPKEGQIPASMAYYADYHPLIRAASPYGDPTLIRQAAESFRDTDVDLLLTDCMGFTENFGRMVAEASGKSVFVPRHAIPELIKAILN